MKNLSRAYNRHMKHVKFIKRVKKWFSTGGERWDGERNFYMNLTLKGKHHTFLKTTGRPCNCDMCTYLKYERKSKGEIKKIIMEGLE
jgi:hypothetical protein